MWAAYTLQHGGVPLHRAASVSLLRRNNSGPHQLLQQFFSTTPYISSWKGLLVATVLLATTILSQFSSTALLSDLGDGYLITSSINSSVVFFNKDTGTDDVPEIFNAPDLWSARSAQYSIFAEPENATVTTRGRRKDVATSFRAILPFALASDRTRLTNYTGMGLTVEYNISCTTPDWTPIVYRNDADELRIWHSGTTMNVDSGPFTINSTTSFNCTIPTLIDPGKDLPTEWAIALCTLGTYDDGFGSLVEGGSWVQYNSGLVLINTTSNAQFLSSNYTSDMLGPLDVTSSLAHDS